MKKRIIANPLMLLAGQQTLSDDADSQIFPLLAHLEEVRTGHGYFDSIRMVTIYMQAMMSCVNNTMTQRNDSLVRMISEAGKAWMAAGEKSVDHGMGDRVVLTADAWQKISRAVRIFLHVLPQVKVYIWTGAIKQAAQSWDYVQNQQTRAKLQ